MRSWSRFASLGFVVQTIFNKVMISFRIQWSPAVSVTAKAEASPLPLTMRILMTPNTSMSALTSIPQLMWEETLEKTGSSRNVKQLLNCSRISQVHLCNAELDTCGIIKFFKYKNEIFTFFIELI